VAGKKGREKKKKKKKKGRACKSGARPFCGRAVLVPSAATSLKRLDPLAPEKGNEKKENRAGFSPSSSCFVTSSSYSGSLRHAAADTEDQRKKKKRKGGGRPDLRRDLLASLRAPFCRPA